jgi:non-heme chloroperoxidase
MSSITTEDGTRIFYKDWGAGPPIVLSHGWPLSSDAWESQMVSLAARGHRVIAHDRRGHGRSGQPSGGNDMDTYADDLATLIDALDLRGVMLVGHSTGGGEVTRYVGRHGTRRVAKLVLVSAVPPLMLKTAANPGGLPRELFDGLRASLLADRSQFYRDFAVPFFGAHRDGAKISDGVRDAFWLASMEGSLKAHIECVAAFSETDFTEDLRRVDVPCLLIHGDDDQIVPIDAASRAAVKLLRDATLKVYEGAPHGIAATHAERLTDDLHAFAIASRRAAQEERVTA